jgi:hypothetical protein
MTKVVNNAQKPTAVISYPVNYNVPIVPPSFRALVPTIPAMLHCRDSLCSADYIAGRIKMAIESGEAETPAHWVRCPLWRKADMAGLNAMPNNASELAQRAGVP